MARKSYRYRLYFDEDSMGGEEPATLDITARSEGEAKSRAARVVGKKAMDQLIETERIRIVKRRRR